MPSWRWWWRTVDKADCGRHVEDKRRVADRILDGRLHLCAQVVVVERGDGERVKRSTIRSMTAQLHGRLQELFDEAAVDPVLA